MLRCLSVMLLFAGILLLLFLSRGEAFIARFSSSLARLPWLARRMGELNGIIEETEHLHHSGTWVRLLLLQLFIVAFEVFTVDIALRSLPLTVVLPSWAGLQVLMFTAIGFALPLLPGAAGSLQVAYLFALRPWGVAIPQALAFSLLAQVGHILMVIGHGGTALLIQAETRSSGEAGLS